MLNDIKNKKIYLACGFTDLRKSVNGLTLIVECDFSLNPFDEVIFIFCNRARNLIKILEWDKDGFWLHIKRLDNGKFKWPTKTCELTMDFTYEDLVFLLGVPKIEQKINKIKPNKIFF